MSDRLSMIEFHTKKAEDWLARYLDSRDKWPEHDSNATKVLLEHHLELAWFHLGEIRKDSIL